jgi:hypothetical protein
MYNDKAVTLPQFKIDHIFENGNIRWVILCLVYNPQTWIPWSYSYYCETGYPTKDRKTATKYNSASDAKDDLDKLIDTIETLRYSDGH